MQTSQFQCYFPLKMMENWVGKGDEEMFDKGSVLYGVSRSEEFEWGVARDLSKKEGDGGDAEVQ